MEALDLIVKNSHHLSWIKDRTLFMVIHGSRSYGTNIESSDTDYKGICCPPKKYFYSFVQKFEQAELKEPDTTIYEIRKFASLAAACNPAIIEVLYTDPSDIVINTKFGKKLIDNRDLFLSKRAKYSFSGYAISQIKRIELHRKYLLNPPKNKPQRKDFDLPEYPLLPKDQLQALEAEVKRQMDQFSLDQIDGLDDKLKKDINFLIESFLMDLHIYKEDIWTAFARKIGLDSNLIEVAKKEREYIAKKREWEKYQEWKINRNEKRATLEAKYGFDGKHGLHCIRLLSMGKEILSEGNVIVKRPDAKKLLAIRNGEWSFEKLIGTAKEMEAELHELYDKSTLRHSPDLEKIDQMIQEIIEEML